MRAIYVGVFKEGSTNVSQARYLEECGVQLTRFDYREIGYQRGYEDMNVLLENLIRNEKPDWVVYAKCHQVNCGVICRTNGFCRHLLWYMDPLNSNFNDELIKKIRACDVTVCAWKGPWVQASKHAGDPRDVYHVAEGFDPVVDHPVAIKLSDIVDVSFIGSADGSRQRYLDAYPITHITGSFGVQHSYDVCRSRININLTRKGGTSDRVYKVLACGGFLLTQPWPGMDEEFTPGKDFAMFDTQDEMVQKIRYYLAQQNEPERTTIKSNGFRAVQKYSRMEWARKLVDIMEGKQ